MINKPTTAADYTPEMVTLVRRTCLYLATKLGDLMDEIVVVGGLVPSLLIDQSNLPADTDPHAGTMDLDLGIAFALVNEERYAEVTERLASDGFKPDLNTKRQIRVCGAGAFVVLKALAFRNRGENKDAYDLFYLLRNYGSSVEAIADELRPLREDSSTKKALHYLDEDFQQIDSIGPKRVAEFLFGQSDETIQADTLGYVRQLLQAVQQKNP
jgi:hypothetical protein